MKLPQDGRDGDVLTTSGSGNKTCCSMLYGLEMPEQIVRDAKQQRVSTWLAAFAVSTATTATFDFQEDCTIKLVKTNWCGNSYMQPVITAKRLQQNMIKNDCNLCCWQICFEILLLRRRVNVNDANSGHWSLKHLGHLGRTEIDWDYRLWT